MEVKSTPASLDKRELIHLNLVLGEWRKFVYLQIKWQINN